MSTTTPSWYPERKPAPRIAFALPAANVATGNRRACSPSMTVPSFWLTYSGAVIPAAARSADTRVSVRSASARRDAFSTVAFSRPIRPTCPTSCDWVTRSRGRWCSISCFARRSKPASTVAPADESATSPMPAASISSSARRNSAVGNGPRAPPVAVQPPSRTKCLPPSACASSGGQPASGSSPRGDGTANRITAVGTSPRACVTASRNCRVPSITAEIASGAKPVAARRARITMRQHRKVVAGGRQLDGAEDALAVHQHTVGGGPADVDPDPHQRPPLAAARDPGLPVFGGMVFRPSTSDLLVCENPVVPGSWHRSARCTASTDSGFPQPREVTH